MKIFQRYLRPVLFISLIVLTWSCNDTEPTPQANEYLVSAEVINSYTTTEFKQLVSSTVGSQGRIDLSLFIQSGIEQIKIVYNTVDLQGNPILASGAVIVPDSPPSTALALASLQHGTIFNEADAPSYFGNSTEAGLGSILASTGMMIALPDYLGYGESKNIPHPYEHKEGLSLSTIDFLKAVKEYIAQENINFNNKLLLAGYSEGGYATMALHQAIQETTTNEFNVILSSIGAGAYNKSASILDIVSRDSAGDPTHNSSYIWVLQTYNSLAGLNRPMSDYFIEPFSSQISQTGPATVITQSFKSILQPAFIAGVTSGTDTEILAAVAENDVFDWKPNAPVTLYHGTADQYVPFLNSQTAFDAMNTRSAADVKLIPVEGGTHSSTINAYFLGTFQLFIANR